MAARSSSKCSWINRGQRGDYLQAIQKWNAQLVEIQRTIRVLEEVRWPETVEKVFIENAARELPRVYVDDYRRHARFGNVSDKLARLQTFERDINQKLGADDPAARLFLRRAEGLRAALRLIIARGTAEFSALSGVIYGGTLSSPQVHQSLCRLVDFCETQTPGLAESERIAAADAKLGLAARLNAYFAGQPIRVILSERLSSDACAGHRYLKLRRSATFTHADVDMLEVHEGWVHLGTGVNGSQQPLFTLLGMACPCATSTQEGLAVFTEMIADVCSPHRMKKLALRFRAVMMAERGADFLQVYRFLIERGCGVREAYRQSARVFRGSLPSGYGPFTKDLTYGLGLISLTKWLRSLIPDPFAGLSLLFSGKACLDDLSDLAELHGAGLLAVGEFVPPFYRDLDRIQNTLNKLPVF